MSMILREKLTAVGMASMTGYFLRLNWGKMTTSSIIAIRVSYLMFRWSRT